MSSCVMLLTLMVDLRLVFFSSGNIPCKERRVCDAEV